MDDNNAELTEATEKEMAIQNVMVARDKILECEPVLQMIKEFLTKKEGFILEDQELKVKEAYREIQPKLVAIRQLNLNYSEADPLDAPYTKLIENLRDCSEDGFPELMIRKEDLLALSSEICQKLGGIELRLKSVIGVVPQTILLEIFQNLLQVFGDLQQTLAGILMTFRGENDCCTVPERMNGWAKNTGTIISFLAEVMLRLPGFGIDEQKLIPINNLLTRCIEVYSPELFFGFIRIVGHFDEMQKFKERIEIHQCDLGKLIDDIELLTDYQ